MRFNERVQKSIKQTGYLNIWEGSVRSSKTVASLLAWMLYVIASPEKVFLMSGKTQGTLFRNCIGGDYGLIALSAGVAEYKTDSNGLKYVQLLGNVIYCAGANDKVAYEKVRGMTIGGWYADEANLHPQSFVEEALRRSIVSKDRRNFWTLNPDTPEHWIYADYLDKYEKDELPGYNYHHFTLDDNPSISEERKEELKRQYSGVFYDRYILGLRVRAEGGIYKSFDNEKNVRPITDDIRGSIIMAEVGIDFGGNQSATAFNLVGYTAGMQKVYVLDEFYDTVNAGTTSLKNNFRLHIEKWKAIYPFLADVFCDSSESLLIKTLRNMALPVNVRTAWKREIIDRIRLEDMLISTGRLIIGEHCTHTISAFKNAVWDESEQDDVRLDDGTTNIDSLDATEYCLERHMKELIEER